MSFNNEICEINITKEYNHLKLKKYPLDLKYMIASYIIDLDKAAKDGLIWVFSEPSIYPIDHEIELSIITSLSCNYDLKYLKIFEYMLHFGGVTSAMHEAIYYAVQNENKPMAHWFYTNVNKKCKCNLPVVKSALYSALINNDIKYINFVRTNYNEGCQPKVNSRFVQQWLSLKELPFDWVEERYEGENIITECDVVIRCIYADRLSLIKKTYEESPEVISSWHFSLMLSYERIEMFQWFYEKLKFEITAEYLLRMANDPKFMGIIIWLYYMGAFNKSDTSVMFSAACKFKNYELLDWLYGIEAKLLMYYTTDVKLASWLLEKRLFRHKAGDLTKAIYDGESDEFLILYLKYFPADEIVPGLLDMLLSRRKLKTAKYLLTIAPDQQLIHRNWPELLSSIGSNVTIYKWIIKKKLMTVPDKIIIMVVRSNGVMSLNVLDFFWARLGKDAKKQYNKKILLQATINDPINIKWINDHFD
jgi:hypothetical protein